MAMEELLIARLVPSTVGEWDDVIEVQYVILPEGQTAKGAKPFLAG
jgi:hypothetical protein